MKYVNLKNIGITLTFIGIVALPLSLSASSLAVFADPNPDNCDFYIVNDLRQILDDRYLVKINGSELTGFYEVVTEVGDNDIPGQPAQVTHVFYQALFSLQAAKNKQIELFVGINGLKAKVKGLLRNNGCSSDVAY